MKFIRSEIEGLFIVEENVSNDIRGSFVKNFAYREFKRHGLECEFRESYFTKSRKDVIRGMHFQVPPHDHAKLITVVSGTIIDVILDIRRSSPTYRRHFALELTGENRKSLYIPRGLAHGFMVLSEQAIAYYQVTSEYHPEADKGILFNSFGYQWPIDVPVLSSRDRSFPLLKDFESPFNY